MKKRKKVRFVKRINITMTMIVVTDRTRRSKSPSAVPNCTTGNPRIRKSGVMDGGVRSSVLGGELW